MTSNRFTAMWLDLVCHEPCWFMSESRTQTIFPCVSLSDEWSISLCSPALQATSVRHACACLPVLPETTHGFFSILLKGMFFFLFPLRKVFSCCSCSISSADEQQSEEREVINTRLSRRYRPQTEKKRRKSVRKPQCWGLLFFICPSESLI